ncbi:hypothetical protein [Leucobacter sp. gxy201]|uniref:hypothetical protein n=1 Tax=Leucobacter sp. gxy201 TaxID=2957200 RepID=UPI003DA0CF3E
MTSVAGLSPYRTAVVETTRGVFSWDALAVDAPDPAPAVGPSGGPDCSDGELRALRRLAWLAWAEAWWPAGRRIAPLSKALLRGEIAVATAAVSHLLDDEDAVERALDDAVAARAAAGLRALVRHEALAPAARALLAQLAGLAEDWGVELDPTGFTGADLVEEPEAVQAPPEPEGWALAAGSSRAGPGAGQGGTGSPVVEGRSPIPWDGLPSGVLDAEAEAEWEITEAGGAMRLRVSAAAAPRVVFPIVEPRAHADLRAVYGEAALGVAAPMRLIGDVYAAEAPLPVAAMLLPPSQRGVRVGDARYRKAVAGGGDDPGADAFVAAALELIAFAEARLRRAPLRSDEGTASVAERAAAFAGSPSPGETA